MPRIAITPYAVVVAGLATLPAANAKPDQQSAPFSAIGVIRYGMNDSSVGKLMFLSSGQPADRILAVCKDGDLCEVSGTARGEEIAKVAKAMRVGRFADPAAPLRWVYSHYKDDRGSFWLEDDDLESLFTPRMAALVVKTRRAAQILEEETAEPSWIGSQDWLIRDLKIDAREQGPGRAVGTMTYRNMIEQNPKPHTTRFDMVLTDAGWRIDEVRTQPDQEGFYAVTAGLSVHGLPRRDVEGLVNGRRCRAKAVEFAALLRATGTVLCFEDAAGGFKARFGGAELAEDDIATFFGRATVHRQRSGVVPAAAGARIGISGSRFQDMERGDPKIPMTSLMLYAEALGLAWRVERAAGRSA